MTKIRHVAGAVVMALGIVTLAYESTDPGLSYQFWIGLAMALAGFATAVWPDKSQSNQSKN